MSYFSQLTQEIIVLTKNCSTANLDADGIFVGLVAVASGICKRGPGTLHMLINNDNAGSVTIYDSIGSASNIIASIDLTKIVSPITFNSDFQTGLSVAVVGVGAKITITFD